MPVLRVETDDAYAGAMTRASGRLVVVDFFATWCAPCTRIAPKFDALSNEFAEAAVFMKVDVDKCPQTTAREEVTAMPTFLFFNSGQRLDSLTGGDPNALDTKVRHWASVITPTAPGQNGGVKPPTGHLNASTFLNKTGIECLNESDRHNIQGLLDGRGDLESDCDAQLLINLPFNQPMKLHSLLLRAPASNGPKTLKLFTNNPNALDFERAEAAVPVQEFLLSPAQLAGDVPVELRYVKFQNVQSLQVFVVDNQNGSDVTRVNGLVLFGSPINATNMAEFKRVAGKAGEVGH